MESELKCLDYYCEPITLMCGHTFCHPCVKLINGDLILFHMVIGIFIDIKR
jgi:hypothetical protein